MKSTLVELPPEHNQLDEDSYVEAHSVEELARKTRIDDRERLARLFLPGHHVGPYHILGFVASGGMGEVYAAERIMDDGKRLGPVALKVIAPEYLDDWTIAARFKREARISRAIRSPHVARVYEFGETDEGHAFMAMELLAGEELFDRLCTHRILSPLQTAELALQILAGLRAVHGSGFIHRDLKPENVFFARQPDGHEVVKILDFGIAKVAEAESDPYLSVVGKIYGTPEYIAPEQGLNPDVDERADLYSVGVIMYECLTGSLPFDGETAYAIILKHQNESPTPLPSTIDAEFGQIVMKALAKLPADRYQSAREMAEIIRNWLERHRDDDLGRIATSSRRAPAETPVARFETPHTGLAPVDTQDRAKPASPDLLEEASAPPVQIFSRPKRLQTKVAADASGKHPRAGATSRETAPQKSVPGETRGAQAGRPAKKPSEDESASGSTVASIITALAILLILAAIGWAMYDSGHLDPSAPEPSAAEPAP